MASHLGLATCHWLLLDFRPGVQDFGVHFVRIEFKIFREALRQVLGFGIVSRFVRPGVARFQNFRWHARHAKRDRLRR